MHWCSKAVNSSKPCNLSKYKVQVHADYPELLLCAWFRHEPRKIKSLFVQLGLLLSRRVLSAQHLPLIDVMGFDACLQT